MTSGKFPDPSPEQKAAKQAVDAWMQKNDISFDDFATATGYRYNWAWTLVRGSAPLGDNFIGRLVNAYGGEIADQVAKILKGEAVLESTD